MAEKCEFVLEPKAVEFTGLIQSMTGKHQLWELWADFIALTAISCSQQLDFRKEREERYLVIASKYDSEEMNSFSRLFALVMDGYEQNREQDMLGSIYMKLNLGSHWTGQFFTPYRVCQAVSGISSNDAVRLIQKKGYVTMLDSASGAGAIVFPPPTHGNGKGLKPYHTAAECIDWSIPAQSIFERDKPLAENTLRRIARGIEKFVINNPEPFIVTVNHSGEGFRGQKADEPLGTITAKNGYGVVTPTIMCNNTGNAGAAVDTPLPTVTTGNRNYMVAPSLIQYHSETANDEVRGQELSEPLMTVDTSPRYALSVAHIMKNYGGNYQGAGSGADKPLDTVTAHDHNSLVTAHILTMRNNMDGQPADEPLATITAGGSHHAEVQAFLVKYFSNGTPKPVNSPLDTVTTKDRFALVTIHGEEYIITDIKMRMLQPRELFNAQGFPEDYIIDHDDSGKPYPKSKQTARCGNAVTPPVPAALVRANLPEMCGLGDGGEQE